MNRKFPDPERPERNCCSLSLKSPFQYQYHTDCDLPSLDFTSFQFLSFATEDRWSWFNEDLKVSTRSFASSLRSALNWSSLTSRFTSSRFGLNCDIVVGASSASVSQ